MIPEKDNIHGWINKDQTVYIHLFIYSSIRSFVRSFVRSSVDPFIRSSVHAFIRSFVHSFIRSFVHSFIRSFVPSFIRSFVHSYVRSFVLSFIYLFINTAEGLLLFFPKPWKLHYCNGYAVVALPNDSFFFFFVYELVF